MKIGYVKAFVTFFKNGTHSYMKIEDLDQEAIVKCFEEIEFKDSVDVKTGEIFGVSRKMFQKARRKFEEDFTRSYISNLPKVSVFKEYRMVATWTALVLNDCDKIEINFKYYFDTDEELEVKL